MNRQNSTTTTMRGREGRARPAKPPGYMDQRPERYGIRSAPNRDPGVPSFGVHVQMLSGRWSV